jgi:hypothetical protein
VLEVLKTIASQSGLQLLAVRVYESNHLHIFVSASFKVCIPEIVRLL